ncbi:phosphoribosyltransferase [Streptomyces albogriseolus]|uniref:phosphoribosyltransferase n=1 Tax=Streptomyces albogriseolus TaxID=1887 RepID=UPI0019A7AB12|nr:phosphoribosyltransferase [Streptomyces sp.]
MTLALVPARTDTARAGGPLVPCDLLGSVRIPASELHTAVRAGASRTLLDYLFPPCDDRGTRLGRGAPYYQPRTALRTSTALATTLEVLDRTVPGQTPRLRHALLDNLHNLAAAGSYALWHDLTDRPARPDDPGPAALDRLLEAATTTAAALHGQAAEPGQLAIAPPDLDVLAAVTSGWRAFRELDNHTKIEDELRFLAEHVLGPRPEITSMLAPLYGSLSLALTARALLPTLLGRPLQVHLIRLGFHDQGTVTYHEANGTVRQHATAPAPYREQLATAANATTVLVVDDNVGYGHTLRSARTLVEQLGGRALTRSVESAWLLYHRSGRHDIADAADLPSLRPNLHHSIQTRLVGHLTRGDAAAYTHDPAHHARGTLHQQMKDSFDLALSTGTWSNGQLAAMRAELAHAASWTEPPAPSPPIPAAA